MQISRWLLGPALALSLVAISPVGADASSATDPDPGLNATPLAKSRVTLDRPERGAAALKALAGRLDVAARQNRTTTKKLHDVLSNDPTAWIGTNGRLFYAEKFERPTTAARTSTGSAAASVPPATKPLASTFQLHSIPGGSAHTVYLDFTGHTLGAGGWTLNGFTKGTYKGFSLDSDYSTFSDAERAYIQHVWQVVAEKYAPFDIDVTTQHPGSDAFNRNGIGDPTYGDHVVFTDVATGSGAKPASICPDGCEGISFTGSFDDPDDDLDLAEPTWVYTGNYHWYSGLAGEIAAHEIGHTLGLEHDGLGTGDGDFGSGNDAYYQGDDVWSPVMGSGIGGLIQFSKGEYPNASNTEDDFAVMQNFGVDLRADDWGDTGNPSALGQQSTYAFDGVLEDAADQDVFTIDRTCTSTLVARVAGIGSGQTADLQLRVLNAAGDTVLGADNPATSANNSTLPRTPVNVDAHVEVATPPTGLVRIEVDGVGLGTPATGGYSDYGSVGRYHLTISGCSGANGATPGFPAGINAVQTPRTGTLTVSWAAPSSPGDAPVTAYRVTGLPSGTVDVPASKTSEVFTGLTPGADYEIGVAAVNAYGAGSALTLPKHLNTWLTQATPAVSLSAYGTTLAVRWTEPPNPGRATPSMWRVGLYDSKGNWLQYFDVDYGYPGLKISGMGNGRYQVRTWLEYGSFSSRSLINDQKVDVGPSATRIATPSSGVSGGTATATARWLAPYTLRGQKITSYTVGAYKLDSSGRVVRVYVSSPRSASARSYVWALPKGRYRFRVQAHATGGWTPVSSYSSIATSR